MGPEILERCPHARFQRGASKGLRVCRGATRLGASASECPQPRENVLDVCLGLGSGRELRLPALMSHEPRTEDPLRLVLIVRSAS